MTSAIPIYMKNDSLILDYYREKIVNDSLNHKQPNKYIQSLNMPSIHHHYNLNSIIQTKRVIYQDLKESIHEKYNKVESLYSQITNTLIPSLETHSITLNTYQKQTITYLQHVIQGIQLKTDVQRLESLYQSTLTNKPEKEELDALERCIENEIIETDKRLMVYKESQELMECVEEYSRVLRRVEMTREDLKLYTKDLSKD